MITIGNNKLYLGDCLEIMKTFPDKSIDCVITDPPYEMVSGGHGKGELADRQTARNELLRSTGLWDGFSNDILNELCRVMKNINIYIFCSKNQIYQLLDYFKNKVDSFDLLCWHKLNPSPLSNMTYLNDTEYLLNFRARGCTIKGTIQQKKKYFLTSVNQKDKDMYGHPTIKPLEIIEQLIINATNSNDTILDCFMGSGTTGVACEKMNRKFIGIEIEQKYFDIAVQRIKAENDQMKFDFGVAL